MAMTVRNEHGHLVREGIEGQCRCGAPATTEVQVGWLADANGGAGGGQYDEICDACEAADYPANQPKARNRFSLLCDIIDLLMVDSAPHIPHPHHQLLGGCVVIHSPKATNGKFTLYLYNGSFTELVDQAEVGNLTNLFDQLSHWCDY